MQMTDTVSLTNVVTVMPDEIYNLAAQLTWKRAFHNQSTLLIRMFWSITTFRGYKILTYPIKLSLSSFNFRTFWANSRKNQKKQPFIREVPTLCQNCMLIDYNKL